jgi:hypothetical protein
VQSCSGRSSQSFRRKRAGGAADTGGRGGRASRAESGSGAQDCADVSGILDAREKDKQGSASGFRRADEIIERSLPRMDERGDSLRVFGVGKALKESVSGAENGKSHLGPIDKRREPFMMAFPGFAKEHSLDAAARPQRFFNKPCAFDTDESILRGEPAAKSDAKLLQPVIVAAGE